MYNITAVSEDLWYVGASDRRLALFENVYPVPRGVSYNSYLLLDEKTVLFDTVDESVGDRFLENVEYGLNGRPLDYIVVHHMEPDHSATLLRLLKTYPEATVVCNRKTEQMIGQFFTLGLKNVLSVKEGDTLSTGKHTFQFVFAPMVHWPEVMMSFDRVTGTLFTADAFGTFGALGGSIFADEVNFERDYLDDARRYYFNIVGKYGAQVQAVLKKVSALDIKTICPLHGPVWRKEIGRFVEKYLTWSAYEAEEKGVVVFYGSIYGHTQNVAEILAAEIAKEGVTVQVYDCSKTHLSDLLAEAFRYSHVVFASATYNNGIFTPVETLVNDLKAHNYQNRKYALIENGSWAPQSGTLLNAALSTGKNMNQLGETIRLISSGKEEQREAIVSLAKTIAQDVNG